MPSNLQSETHIQQFMSDCNFVVDFLCFDHELVVVSTGPYASYTMILLAPEYSYTRNETSSLLLHLFHEKFAFSALTLLVVRPVQT